MSCNYYFTRSISHQKHYLDYLESLSANVHSIRPNPIIPSPVEISKRPSATRLKKRNTAKAEITGENSHAKEARDRGLGKKRKVGRGDTAETDIPASRECHLALS